MRTMRLRTYSAVALCIGSALAAFSSKATDAPLPETQPEAAAALVEGVQFYTGIGRDARDSAAAAAAFRRAAEQGFAPAQYAYAICLRHGRGVEQDAAEAVRWYRAAAAQGYAPAQTSLGVCYERGEGVEKKPEEAVRLYRLAAEQGYSRAQTNLGSCYSNGLGVQKDQKQAIDLYYQAAGNGHAVAQNNLGWAYMNGLGVRSQIEVAISWLECAAAQGQQNALVNLGKCYEKFLYNSPDRGALAKKIYQTYRLAAHRGFSNAQHLLGECYAEGIGVEKDPHAAAMWYRAAADQDNRFAQYELGKCYEYARGVRYNMAEAVRLYRLSAEQKNPNGMATYARCCMDGEGGAHEENEKIFFLLLEGLGRGEHYPFAMTLLGECYEKGIGTAPNPEHAGRLYCNAGWEIPSSRVRKNHYRCLYLGIGGEKKMDDLITIWHRHVDSEQASDAMNELGVSYELGEGVEKLPQIAVKWYQRGAEHGSAVARYNLARCYWWGIGVEKDRNKAAEWYSKSANKAFKPAIEAYKRIGLKLNPVFKDGRYYMMVPLHPRTPQPDAPDPEGTEPLRSFLCGREFFAWDDIPYHPSYELKAAKVKTVAAEDMPPEKTSAQLSEEMVRTGDEHWANGKREEAIEHFRKAAALWDEEAYLRLALCAHLGLGMPQDEQAARQYISAALNISCELAPIVQAVITTP